MRVCVATGSLTWRYGWAGECCLQAAHQLLLAGWVQLTPAGHKAGSKQLTSHLGVDLWGECVLGVLRKVRQAEVQGLGQCVTRDARRGVCTENIPIAGGWLPF